MPSDYDRLSQIQAGQVIDVEKPRQETQNKIDYLEKNHSIKHLLGKVQYNFDPFIYRKEALNFASLIQVLNDKYDLIFDVPRIIQMSMEQRGGADNDLYLQAFKSPGGLEFKDGVVIHERDGDTKSIIIRLVNLHSQNISVTLDGTTAEAETVVQKVVYDILSGQKLDPAWSNFKKAIAGAQYTSTSVVDLKVSTNKLLSEKMNDFVEDIVIGRLAYAMADKVIDGPNQSQNEFQSTCFVDELKFRISTFNKETGSHDTYQLSLSNTDRRLVGTGVVAITSELKFDDHIDAIHSLVTCF